jgi:AGCS family alanine or glycine:cation symporter
MMTWVQSASNWLWGPPMLTLVLGTGIYLFVRLRAVQLRDFGTALRATWHRSKAGAEGDVSPMAALMTAVGGIVGNGNIAGVATAITAGGPGALFWMWVSGVFGMATMFAESVLGVRYRKRGRDGLFVGGPMYYLRDGLGWPKVAAFFAFGLAAKTLMATTTVQSNSIASVVGTQLGWPPLVSCAVVAVMTGLVILGGVKWVGRTSELLTPLMGVIYLAGAAAVLVTFAHEIPCAFALVFEHAFTPVAGVGGFAGATVKDAFRFGVARGVYSNEAGTGSVPIAHASAKTNDPIRQGHIAMLGVFLDTLVVATATGLVLIVTGVWRGSMDSTALAADAFEKALGSWGGPTVMVASFLFGLTTLISWSFYGEQSAVYLFGAAVRKPYRLLYCIAILGGSLAGARATWAWADLLNAIMTIPNLIALLLLSGEVCKALFGVRQTVAVGEVADENA